MEQEYPNVRIMCYDDLEMLKDAVASIPSEWTVYICDGRFQSFYGEKDRSPEIEEWAAKIRNVKYRIPDDDKLPFGVDRSWDDELRPGVTAKGEWMLYDVLPQDEWVLKMDTDERLLRFDVDLDDLDPRTKYCPKIDFVGEDNELSFIERLYVPKYWSVWADDCLLPIDGYPRNTPPEEMKFHHTDTRANSIRKRYTELIHIKNVGTKRRKEYQERRLHQLDQLGREGRKRKVSEILKDRHNGV